MVTSLCESTDVGERGKETVIVVEGAGKKEEPGMVGVKQCELRWAETQRETDVCCCVRPSGVQVLCIRAQVVMTTSIKLLSMKWP